MKVGGEELENWKKNARRDVAITDIDVLVSKDHLLRKIEKIMDYEWLYEKRAPYYNHDVGRPGIDPVVLIKQTPHSSLYEDAQPEGLAKAQAVGVRL